MAVIIDAHTHIFPNFALSPGFDNPAEWKLRQQNEIRRMLFFLQPEKYQKSDSHAQKSGAEPDERKNPVEIGIVNRGCCHPCIVREGQKTEWADYQTYDENYPADHMNLLSGIWTLQHVITPGAVCFGKYQETTPLSVFALGTHRIFAVSNNSSMIWILSLFCDSDHLPWKKTMI